MNTFVFYAIFLMMGLWTLRMLPWINADAAFRLQIWMTDLLDSLHKKLEDLEKED